jgi:hypothetical protein
MIKRNLLGSVLMVLLLAGTSFAQESGEHSHHTPSQAAIDACSGKAVGDSCNYTNSKGEDKSGTCANTSDNQLFCKRVRKSS